MKADNVFELIGNLELGLTKATAFMLRYNRKLLKVFLKEVGIRSRAPSGIQVDIEVPDEHGRTDVEVKHEQLFHLVIEGKVGGNLPSSDQLRRYASKISPFKGEKRLCIITEVDSRDWLLNELFKNERFFEGLSQREVCIFTWQELHEKFFNRIDLNDELNRQYEDYLEEMIMQNEILVVSADPDLTYGKEDADFFRHHLYWYTTGTIKKRHNYIALYLPSAFGAEQGIHEIAKILRYELCTVDELGIPKNCNYYRKMKEGDTGKRECYKLVLGDVITLPRKIKKSRGRRVRNWTTTFEKLLKAEWTDQLLCQPRQVARAKPIVSKFLL